VPAPEAFSSDSSATAIVDAYVPPEPSATPEFWQDSWVFDPVHASVQAAAGEQAKPLENSSVVLLPDLAIVTVPDSVFCVGTHGPETTVDDFEHDQEPMRSSLLGLVDESQEVSDNPRSGRTRIAGDLRMAFSLLLAFAETDRRAP
jgi:hypothetical protein